MGPGATTEDVPDGEGDRPENGSVSVDEANISAALDGRELVVRVPVARVASRAVQGELTLELRSVDDTKLIDSTKLKYSLGSEASEEIEARVTLSKAVADQATLVGFNLRVTDGQPLGLQVTRSAFTALPRYEVRLEGPARVTADKTISYRVRAHDPRNFQAVPNAPVELTLSRAGEDDRVLKGTTSAEGDVFFSLSLPEAGEYEVRAGASTAGTTARLSEQLSVESEDARMLLTTDKPLYQPGQTVHLRALSLDKAGNTPIAKGSVLFEISDAKGNKIFKRKIETDGYGIAATSFRLGSVVNMGTFSVRTTLGDVASEKTFVVGRYVLPKFGLDIDLDKAWYGPGETLHGRIDARYFFGKDVVNGAVSIDASTLDVGQNAFQHVVGSTGADGSMEFTVKLPATLAGLPLEQGNALVSLHVGVTDAAGQLVEKDAAVIVAGDKARLVLVPEGTELVPGIENQLQLFVVDPLGAPLANVELAIEPGQGAPLTVTSDAFGQARVSYVPDDLGIDVVATLPGGAQVSQSFNFASQKGDEHVIVRSDRAVYDVGDTVKIELETTDLNGSVYVDWLNEGQAVGQRTLQAKDGKVSFEVGLDTGYLGNNRVEAYVVDAGGNVVRAGRTLFVRNDAALTVELATDQPIYEPGQPAELTFTVKDEKGKPAVAALGVQIVDEAVFSLVDAKPGLLRTYFEIDDAFATPHYEIDAPPGSLSGLLYGKAEAEDPAEEAADQRRAQATFAALGTGSVTGIHTGSWQATIARVLDLLEPSYAHEKQQLATALTQVAAAGVTELAAAGCTPEMYYCNAQNAEFGTVLRDYIYAHSRFIDPWGQRYAETDDGYTGLTFVSDGPDEVAGTEDDGRVSVSFPELGLDQLISWRDEGQLAGGGGGNGGGNGGEVVDFDPAQGGAQDAGVAGPPTESDDGDAAEPRVRRDFPETLYVNPALITGPDGTARVSLDMADSITEWRVSTLANAQSGKLGGSAHGITVFQDFFADIGLPATLTRGDEVSFPVALYNYLDVAQTVTLSLDAAPWYTALGATSATVELLPNQVKGLTFPVRVNDVGLHTLTVKAIGTDRSDAVERAVRVVPNGKSFPTALSGALGAGSVSQSVSYPANAVPGSGELVLSVFPAFLSSAVSGMDSLLQEPSGCFEQTTSTTWPNALVSRYMRDTKQITPEIQLKAEAYISAGYQRLLTFEHPNGGFSWFGTQDPAPYLSVTAFGVMEFVDMAEVYEVDPAMLARTVSWLAAQQESDGSWPGDQTEFFSFHTSLVRNTAFVAWSLATAGFDGPEMTRALGYLRAHYDDNKEDGYTLALVANAFAVAAPTDPTLDAVLAVLDGMKHVNGDKISWDSGETQTDFYGAGNDAVVTTTALVAHALLSVGGYPDQVKGAIDFLSGSRDASGNFGSTQATIWTLRTLLLAASKGTEGAVGTLSVTVDGSLFTTLNLTADQGDVMTTVDLAALATTGSHDVLLNFAGKGKVSYNLVTNYHVPWSEVPVEPAGPLAVAVRYDRTSLTVNDTVSAEVSVQNLTQATANMILVDVGIPPGFEVLTNDLDAYLAAHTLSKYEVTPRQLILYVSELVATASTQFTYRLRATMPVKATDGGATVYPYYEPSRESHAAAQTLQANE